MVKVRMLKIESGPDGSYDVGAIRYVEEEQALALIADRAAVEVKDGDSVAPPKKETATERRAREKAERDAAAKAKADAEAKAKAEAKADGK